MATEHIVVVGAGQMGAGIAQVSLVAGLRVTLVDVSKEGLAKGADRIRAGLGKLVEIGNSGMFRPEMLEPMGLPKDMRVFGWGLSLERPTMIKYKISNIRELLGHKVDLNFIERNPAVILEKE